MHFLTSSLLSDACKMCICTRWPSYSLRASRRLVARHSTRPGVLASPAFPLCEALAYHAAIWGDRKQHCLVRIPVAPVAQQRDAVQKRLVPDA